MLSPFYKRQLSTEGDNGWKGGGEERKRKARDKAHGLDYGGRIRETQGKSTISNKVKSLDISTSREADGLKQKTEPKASAIVDCLNCHTARRNFV